MSGDPRRSVPSTDAVLSDARLADPLRRLGRPAVRHAVHAAQARVREGSLDPGSVVDAVIGRLPPRSTTLRPVLNATGVVLHTNLGRAALSPAARDALAAAAGFVDVEFNLITGARDTRGRGALAALRAAIPDAGDVLIVNNGAAALLLAVSTIAAGGDVVWSRGEMVEIGDGFRLPDLVACTGAVLREVGTTNRTVAADYAAVIGDRTGCLLKVHTSNFRVEGFTAAAGIEDLAALGPPVIVDVGSGLLGPDRLLPGEPDIAGALRAGADLVIASADKLLGGPQAGLIAGREELIARLRRHPMYRAVRVDKLTLAALEATLRGPATPTALALRVDVAELRGRAEAIATRLGGTAEVVPSDGVVGGGSGSGITLPGWAISLPEAFAAALRAADPAVVGRVERGRCLLDLRCIPASDDLALVEAVLACR